MPVSKTQNYMLFFTKSSNVHSVFTTMLLLVIMVITSCDQSREKFFQTDYLIMESLNHYFDQEKSWAKAVIQNDPIGAGLAVDSMSQILITLETAYYQIHTSNSIDSLYYNNFADLLNELQQQNTRVFPIMMQLAFIPDPGYTTDIDQKMMGLLKELDISTSVKLEAFYQARHTTFQRYGVEPL
jgi:hypothetical protein